MDIWDLDNHTAMPDKGKEHVKQFTDTHPKFKIGDTITFFTGYNDDIRAKATIKGIQGNDLYVYNDCYWFPIQDDSTRKIEQWKK